MPLDSLYTRFDYSSETGVLSPRHSDVIKEAVRKHRNILVIGGTADRVKQR